MTPRDAKVYFLFVGFAALAACPADVEQASSNGARCGDGRLELGEACDDGNDVSGDGCGACTPELGYTCDTAVPSICRAVCGDGIWVPPEECDDGGLMGGDGCTSKCRVRLGWAPPRTRHTAVWTGAEMIIFGGVRSGGASGGRYRPSDRTWRPLERTGMPSSRFSHSAIPLPAKGSFGRVDRLEHDRLRRARRRTSRRRRALRPLNSVERLRPGRLPGRRA